MILSSNNIMASLEAMLFAAGDPVEPGKLAEVLDVDVENVIKMLGHLEAMYDENNRGLRLIRIDGKYQLCTREEYSDEVRGLLEIKKNTPLSQAGCCKLASLLCQTSKCLGLCCIAIPLLVWLGRFLDGCLGAYYRRYRLFRN